MTLEIEEEVVIEEEITELGYQSVLLQVILNHGPRARSKMIEMIDIKELSTEWRIKKEEVVEEEEGEESLDLPLTADLDLTTVEKTPMIQETEEEAKEGANLTSVEEAEVEAKTV